MTNVVGSVMSASAALSVVPLIPALNFAAIPAKTFGDAPFAISAASNSSGAVNYVVASGPATISGATVTITGVGNIFLSASQVANGSYAAATATMAVPVAPEVPGLSFAPIPARTFGAPAFSVDATSASSGAITYAVASGPATVSGSSVTLTGAGTVVLSASQPATGNYAAATATTSFTVGDGTPTLAFATIPAMTFGAAPFSVTATSASTGPVAYAVTSGPATVSGSTVTLSAAGTVVLSATQAANGSYAAASATTTFTVAPETPALTFAALATTPFGSAPITVSATSASSGPITYAVTSGPATIAGSTLTLTGTGTVVLSAAQAANGSYAAANATASFTVIPGVPALSFAPVAPRVYGNGPFAVSATSASPAAVTYAVTGGPATVAGATVTLTGPGTVVLSASQAGSANYAAANASTSFTVTAAPPTTVALSTTSFDFGQSLVGSTLTKPVVTLTNTGGAILYFYPTLSGDPSYAISASQTCGATLAAGASCAIGVSYAPATASGATPQMSTLGFNFGNAGGTSPTVSLTGVSAVLAPGTVSSTGNPQVALYTVTLPYPGTVTVNFGPSTSYGRQTWTKTAAAAGPVSLFVAGMLPSSNYHLQAAVQLTNNGDTAVDTDHSFTTGAPPFLPNIATATTPGMTPQPGVEQFSISNGVYFSLAVSDLQGNILWSYALPGDTGGYSIEGAKLMSNGDFLVTIGEGSAYSLSNATSPPGAVVAIREIDLAGNTVQELTAASLSAKLQAAGYDLTLQQFHHDVASLPNGHWLVLSNTMRNFTNLPGYPGTTTVLGDVVIDLDQNLNPVWVWDEFDHMDVNRHPWNFPDWTHTNTVLYSPTDGNLIVSMRHQNWVVKVDYENGAGSGNILWHLGEGGDFTLLNGTDPTDWNYAQHFPSFFSPNTAGVFSLGLMDNGDDRQFPTGVVCGTSGQPPCQYTSIPVFQIDEHAMTATLTFHQILPVSLYSFFGGNTDLLANGDIEYDLAGTNTDTADIYEVTPTSNPQTVWHLHSVYNAYRGYRLPSLYPGVQW